MMEKKTNIFLCITEYHVLLSILLASEKYSSDFFLNRIILCNEGRFNDKNRYDYTSVNNIAYTVYDLKYFRSEGFVKEILSCCSGSLFVFNMNNPHFMYLIYRLKKTGQAETAFVQEGLASYNVIEYTLRKRLSRIKYDFISLKQAGIRDLSFYFYGFGIKGCFGKIFDYYRHAIDSPLVDSFWLSLPEEAMYGKNKVKKIPSFTNNSIEKANSFFKYDQPLSIEKNDIVFIDQRIDGSYEFIDDLSNTFPDNHIYIKLHPRTKQETASIYENNPNVRVLSLLRGIPVELLLLNLKQVIVLTPFSSALLMNNPSCHYYYTYKWHLEHGYGIENNNLFTPGQHIRIINSIDEIELF